MFKGKDVVVLGMVYLLNNFVFVVIINMLFDKVLGEVLFVNGDIDVSGF